MSLTPEKLQEVLNDAELLLSPEQLMVAFDKMAEEITAEMQDMNPIMLPVMNGALIPAAELCKRLRFPIQFDYVHASRYRGKLSGADHVHWVKEPSISLKDRAVLVVDDVLDGGQTLDAIVSYCYGMGAKKVYTAVMLDKKDARDPQGLAHADFVGLEIPADYVIGFGLDYHDYLRNAPGVYKVAKHHA